MSGIRGEAQWRSYPLGNTLFSVNAVDCPTESICFAIGTETPAPDTLGGNAQGPEVLDVYKSTDGGLSWTMSDSDEFLSLATYLTCATADLCVITGPQGWLVTDNGGSSWTSWLQPPDLPESASCPSPEFCLGVRSASGSLFAEKSVDGGQKWSSLRIAGSTSKDTIQSVSCSSDTTCVIVAEPQWPSPVPVASFVTHDGGLSWRPLTEPENVQQLSSVSCPESSDTCEAVGQIDGAFEILSLGVTP